MRKSYLNETFLVGVLLLAFVALLLMHGLKQRITYDTGLYHLHFVQWLSSYGAVPGLGNLDGRLAYNSFFLQIAAWLDILSPIRVYHYVQVLVIAVSVAGVLFVVRKKPFSPSSLFALMAFPFVGFYKIMLHSLYQDIAIYCGLLFLFVGFTRAWFEEKRIHLVLWFGLACLLITFKLSALFVMGLLPLLLWSQLSDLNRSSWVKMAVIAALIMLPWMWRGVWLSGYPLYPTTALDWFSVDWKMPAYLVENMKLSAQAFNRLPRADFAVVMAMPFTEWFPLWWKNQSLHYPQWLLWSPLFGLLLQGVTFRFRNKLGLSPGRLLVAYAFFWMLLALWLFQSPSIRFGLPWMVAVTAIPLSLLLSAVMQPLKMIQAYSAPIYLALLVIGLLPGSGLVTFLRSGHVEVKDIPEQVAYVERRFPDGKALYEPLEGELIYDKLPMPAVSRLYSTFTVPFINDYPKWRGECLEDGFVTSESKEKAEVVGD